MSALGSLVVKLALNHAEYTQGLSKTDQSALKFAQNSQRQFDRAERAAKQAFKSMALGAAGVIASLVGINQGFGKIKGIIDFQDEIGKLSQKTGLAVETLAGLDFAASQSGTSLETTAKGVRSFSRIVADSSGALNKNSEILRALGIDLEDLKSKTPEEQFFALADAVQDLGEQDRAVAVTSLLGDRMADLVPLLSGGSDRLRDLVTEGQKYNPVTAESAARAEVFNDNLDRLGRSSGVLAQQLTIGLVSSLSEVATEMAEAAEQGGILQGVLVGLGSLAKTVGLASLGPIGALIANRSQIEDVSKGISQTTDEIEDITGESEKASSAVKTFAQTLADIDKQFTKTSRSANTLTKAEQGQEREAESLKRDIEKLTRAYDPLIERNERLARLLEKREAGLPENIFNAESTKAINEYIDATSGVIEKTEEIANVTRSTTSQMDQLWIQSGRNIQSALANSIFNFFDDGLKGMLRNAISTAGRIGSEFAALGLARSIGIGSLFASGSAAASGASGSFDLANVGSSLLGGLASARSFLGGSVFASGTGGAGTAFIGGPGTAIGGSGLGATGGLSLASGGLVLGAALLTKGFNDLIANDNKIAGVTGSTLNKIINPLSQIPVIGKFLPDFGGILTGIFGRGESKFRQQFLGGNASESGFGGSFVTDVFRSKGGLLRGNKHSQQDAANADEILGLFDDSIKAFFGSTRALAENLNLDAQALDNLTFNVAIQSEKKKAISQEQIAAEMARLSDSIAESVLPNISELTRGSETYANTLSRLSGEMTTLTNAGNVFGLSLQDSSSLISGFSFETRTALIDSLGGIDAVSQKTQFFANNFLTDAEKVDLASQAVNKTLSEFGETAESISKGEFGDLLKSFIFLGEQGAESANKLFDVAGSFLIVKDAAEQVSQASIDTAEQVKQDSIDAAQAFKDSQLIGVNDSFSGLQQSVDAERNKLTNQYNDSIKEVNDSIGKLTSLSSALKSTTEAINPLGLDQAKNNLRGAIAQSRSGNVVDLNSVRTSLAVLSKNDTSAFRTREEFVRSQEENTSLLDQLGGITDDQLTAQEQSLDALTIGFNTEIGRLDSIISNAQLQLDALNGIDSKLSNLSVNDALGNFNTRIAGSGGSTVAGLGGSTPFNGNPNITGAQIQDFLAANDDPLTIYNAARDNNVTGLQLAANSPFTVDQINQFADENDLPRLRVGTNFIPRDMPVFAHKGEQVKPKAFVDNERAERKELVGLMSKVLKATETSTVSNNKVKKTLDKWEKVGMPKERAA